MESLPATVGGAAVVPPEVSRLIGERLLEAMVEAGEEVLSPALLDAVAAELRYPRAFVYAAGLVTWRPYSGQRPVRVAICAGKCQSVGALPLLEHLLNRRDERAAEGRPTFDLIPRSCLNGCTRGPTVFIITPAGIVGLAEATTRTVDTALAEIDEAEAWT